MPLDARIEDYTTLIESLAWGVVLAARRGADKAELQENLDTLEYNLLRRVAFGLPEPNKDPRLGPL